jgi:hypothetical protein
MENITMTIQQVRRPIVVAQTAAAELPEVIGNALDIIDEVAPLDTDVASLIVENPRGYKDLEVSVAEFPRSGRRIKIASKNPAQMDGSRSDAAAVYIHETGLSDLIAALILIEGDQSAS